MLASVIALGLTISFTLVAVVGGLWNMEHTLMQRYGFARIYGRRTGEDDGRLERTLLLSWLVVTLLSVAADARTPGAASTRCRSARSTATGCTSSPTCGRGAVVLLAVVVLAVAV